MQQQVSTTAHKNPLTLTEMMRAQIVEKYSMSDQQLAEYTATVSIGLFKLRTAYSTQARNYTAEEADALTALWLEHFVMTPADVLYDAINRFIKTNNSGFYPSVGQIMSHVDEIIAERKYAEYERIERILQHEKYMQITGGF